MIAALEAVQDESKRLELMRTNLLKDEEFEWDTMVDALQDGLSALTADHNAGQFASFFEKWHRLRSLQSSVDDETLD
jgi:hypothetical protein